MNASPYPHREYREPDDDCRCAKHGYIHGTCVCSYGDGPQEDCPIHGRPYAEWAELATAAQRELGDPTSPTTTQES